VMMQSCESKPRWEVFRVLFEKHTGFMDVCNLRYRAPQPNPYLHQHCQCISVHLWDAWQSLRKSCGRIFALAAGVGDFPWECCAFTPLGQTSCRLLTPFFN
jgi:hypothetical protein